MRWGNGWRMPTSAEMDNLFNGPNTLCVQGKTKVRRYNHETGESYYVEDVDAWMVTSTITNNTIILPKTGYYGSNEKTDSNGQVIIIGCRIKQKR